MLSRLSPFVLAFGLSASVSLAGPADKGLCAKLVGRYQSTRALSGGILPGGETTAPWTLSFGADGQFHWKHADMIETGPYQCKGKKLSAGKFRAKLAADGESLVWEGEEYRRLP
jgi:hypothetical protein